MADNRNLCEEIEIAIYSDAELTEEQKSHIENCESCKALLSQISQMKNDLGALSVPGIVEGSIAKSVMDSIKAQKTSRALPRFRITHHLGTAAAVVIILAAAIIIKNPADMQDNASVKYSDIQAETQSTEDAPIHMFSAVYDDTEAVVETESDSYDAATEEAPVMLKSARPGKDTATQEEAAEEEPVVMFKAVMPKNAAADTQPALPENAAENSEEVLLTDNNNKQPEDDNFSTDYGTDEYSSAGGGGSSARDIKIFAMEDFGDDLYENIEIANRIFFELSGISDYFKAEDFESNEEFLKAIENFTFALEN